MNQEIVTIEVNVEWSQPIPVDYGKDIVAKLSEEYHLVSILIKGDNGTEFLKTRLGDSNWIIQSHFISHIKNPVIYIRTEADLPLRATIKVKEP